MDADVVESVGRQLFQRGESVRHVVRSVDRLVADAESRWWGTRGGQFVHEWRDSHRPALLRIAQALGELGETALRNATEQRDASSSAARWTPDSRGGGMTRGRVDVSPGTALDLLEGAYGGEADRHGYVELRDEDLLRLGIDPGLLKDDASGFGAAVYRGRDGNYVLAFPGTQDLADWKANLEGATGTTRQSEEAAAAAIAVVGSVGAANVTLIGHSLGGRNAAIGGIATGARTLTFNAAGTSDADIANALAVRDGKAWPGSNSPDLIQRAAVLGEKTRLLVSGQVTNHVLANDPLTLAQTVVSASSAVAGSPSPAPIALGRVVVETPNKAELWSHDVNDFPR